MNGTYFKIMKHFLLILITVVLVVACGPSVDIHKAARDGNIEAVKQHLAAGADVNAKTKSGLTPLHHAAFYGHMEIAELLIEKGADVKAKDMNGKTPLDEAIKRKHTETADILRKHGAKTSEELKTEGK